MKNIEQARQLYKTNPEYRNTLLSEYSDEELGIKKELKSWEELEKIKGYYINNQSEVTGVEKNLEDKDRNIFATEKQAKSALAMAQLSQLMKDLGDECDVDWNDSGEQKYCIYRRGNEVVKDWFWNNYYFLAFRTAKVRSIFLEKHLDLIKEYFML